MNEFSSVYVGLDVHKETIAVGVARSGRGAPEYFGEIKNSVAAVRKLLKRLSPDGEVLQICYEAGPCGYGLYRQIKSLGHECEVVAPSLIPRKAGERMKTDRRDGLKLAHEHRAGGLTAVWVPDEEQEAVRDLTRAREDMKAIEAKARQRLGAFLLRHGRVFEGKSRWTLAHFRWLETVKFAHPVGQIVLQEYIDTVKEARRRVEALELQMRQALPGWSLGVLIEAAWNYRFPARKTRDIQKRAEKTSVEVQAIAWQGQKRLCGRYQALMRAGKEKKQVTTAVARELAGFIWAIACEVTGKPHASKALA